MNTSERGFYLDSNGITIKCENTISGDKGIVDGIEYECVDNDLLKERIKENSDLSRLCTSLVTDMYELFKDSTFNQPIGNWDVNNVECMNSMFWNSQFNRSIEKWDVKNVVDMSLMFYGSSFNLPIKEWNVSSVSEMSGMYWNSEFDQSIGEWNVSAVIDMRYMFIHSKFNQNISNWCVTNIPEKPREFSKDSLLTEENNPIWGFCPD